MRPLATWFPAVVSLFSSFAAIVVSFNGNSKIIPILSISLLCWLVYHLFVALKKKKKGVGWGGGGGGGGGGGACTEK